MRFLSRSPAQTKRMAMIALKRALGRGHHPVILALSGNLGSGKTVFVQGLARALGVRGKIQSPTFVFLRQHKLPKKAGPFRRLIHIDAYRIERPAEARHLGLQEIFKDRQAIIVIEWAERIRKLIPKSAAWIHFKHKAKNQRIITMTK